MSWLLDTNILSELRKGNRADDNVKAWADRVRRDPQWISVLSLGEIRKGIEQIRQTDPKQAGHLDDWLLTLSGQYSDLILPVCSRVADVWGRLQVERSLPVVDSLLVATASVHRLRIATRNVADFTGLGIEVVDPFSG
jgi:predicted nucleic acid-binding protein